MQLQAMSVGCSKPNYPENLDYLSLIFAQPVVVEKFADLYMYQG